jgi:hypothetical protein
MKCGARKTLSHWAQSRYSRLSSGPRLRRLPPILQLRRSLRSTNKRTVPRLPAIALRRTLFNHTEEALPMLTLSKRSMPRGRINVARPQLRTAGTRASGTILVT